MINLSKKLWSVILILVFIFIFFSWNIDFLCTKSTIKNEEKCEKVDFSRDYSFSKNFSTIIQQNTFILGLVLSLVGALSSDCLHMKFIAKKQ